MKTPGFKEFIANPYHILAFGFGSGLAPRAPGTAGTLAAIPFFLIIQNLHWPLYLLCLVVSFGLGVWWCDRSSKALGVHDHGGIVWDEFVGYWVTMFMAPTGPVWILVGFILFRFFDIIKPWPINFLDRKVSGGLGIMIDDVLAGIYALCCLQLVAYLISR